MEEAARLPPIYLVNQHRTEYMIDKDLLKATVLEALQGTNAYLVDIQISKDNDIVVEIDSNDDVDLDFCVDLTRKIEARFDREIEDYSLEVGSAGLTAPFKVVEQYLKNLGKEVEVLTKDGRKLHGVLTAADGDTSSFTIEIPTKVKEPGAKRPTIKQVPEHLKMDECKQVKHVFKF